MFKHNLVVVLVVLLMASNWAIGQTSRNEQLPSGAAKQKAEDACLACHEGRIIVQQRLTKADWTKEVDKMIRWGAVVDPKDREELIDYFSSAIPADQPAYVPPRSTVKTKPKH